ncbi:universal stress protein [Reinekea marinisedimentorum]|uniref:Nucleotide-binding universal stress UspA family protein n=1 Tax=Reinekea marinisedimentorum TaxID=230495 RepID=A0A4R3IB84_9GAMM|nr:universal stress protein [Reinekea marinisedimentorum]TCS42521.1 nucleotide-binding universal stress UspA family protein [Reinekea marinisedimentorum]
MTTQFKNILCYIDPVQSADATLATAVKLASENNAQLTLASVVRPIPHVSSLQPAYAEIQKDQLNTLAEKISSKALSVKTELIVSDLGAIDVVKLVHEKAYDLVIKPADHGVIGKVMKFGSQDYHLLRKCPSPVWVNKQDQDPKSFKILAAVDVDPLQEENKELNQAIIAHAKSLVSAFDGELHIVHAWGLPTETKNALFHFNKTKAAYEEALQTLKGKHSEWWDTFLKESGLSEGSYHAHFLNGSAEEVIPELADSICADVTVMGTVARTGIPGFFIGNTAEKILSDLNSSVLAIKPVNFVSPILE